MFKSMIEQTVEAAAEQERIEDCDERLHVCPECLGEGRLLGTLGSTDHYRCRDCGWEWSGAEEG